MGENFQGTHFELNDFRRFEDALRAETLLLKEWLEEGRFTPDGGILGWELEGWLVNNQAKPVPRAEEYIKVLQHPDATFELSRFMVEFNADAKKLTQKILRETEQSLTSTWRRAQETAQRLGMNFMLIGTLPTLKQSMLNHKNMSPLDRYKALDQQVFRLRDEEPITLDIKGADHLNVSHDNIMLGSAPAAFQIHLQIGQHEAVRAYNISKIISAPLVGAVANSRYLFGKELHAETRVPLYTQALSVSPWTDNDRVTFGISHADSIFEIFNENVKRYPPIMPTQQFIEEPLRKMRHVNFHNGTIYRWTRLIVGVNDSQAPTLRLEQRVPPSGPTPVDMTANIAFFCGLMYYYLKKEPGIIEEIPFYDARDNFFKAAKKGLDAEVVWKREKTSIQKLILEDLLPKAREGLALHGLDPEDIEKYLSIIEKRVETKQNGAEWQRLYVAHNDNATMNELCRAYLRNQITCCPVNEWDLSR